MLYHAALQRVTDFEIVAPYTLRVHFADGTAQTINFEPMLYGEVFGELRDLAVFNGVRLDRETENLIWPNDADFDPADLHDWPEVQEDYIAWAAQWRSEVVPAVAGP